MNESTERFTLAEYQVRAEMAEDQRDKLQQRLDALRDVSRSGQAIAHLVQRAEKAEAERETARQQLADLLIDLMQLEDIYATDGIASLEARQIERIFDRWLHGDTDSGTASSRLRAELSEARQQLEALRAALRDKVQEWLRDSLNAQELADRESTTRANASHARGMSIAFTSCMEELNDLLALHGGTE